jgi:hypothetical protein
MQAGVAGHYRWVDENGTVKYADRPPEGINAEFIKFASTKHSKPGQQATSQDSDGNDSEAASGPRRLETLPAKDPELCKQAQRNLKALEAARIRITEPDGSKRVLNEDEKEEQRENARKFIKVHC